MGFLSDAWDSVSDAASDAWGDVKGAVKDFTGLESMNDFFNPIAQGAALLQGKGIIGETLQPLLNPMLQPAQQPPGGGAMTGPLTQNAPASLTMGAGGVAPAQVAGSPNNLASYFGGSGYSFGPTETSAALLKPNSEAYQFSPLASNLA